MTKILKVKVNNIPKDKDFKVIQLSTKKTYYFKEFDEILTMIRELAEEKEKSYPLDISIVDYDDPTISSFEMPQYLINKNTKTSIFEIIKMEMIKDKDIDEKNVSQEYIDAYKQTLEESNNYDVAKNNEVKSGSLKKASIFSKLRRKKNSEVEEETTPIDDEELDQVKEDSLDEVAGNRDAENIMKATEVVSISGENEINPDEEPANHGEVVDLTDSQDRILATEEKEHKEVSDNNVNQLADSVTNSGNQLNDNNQANIESVTYSSKQQILKEDEQKKVDRTNTLNLNDIEKEHKENFDSNQILNLKEERIEPQKFTEDVKEPEEKNEQYYLNTREKQKADFHNEELNIIENELIEFIINEETKLNKELETFYNENKPKYQDYLEQLIETERPVFDEKINLIDQQLSDEIEMILKSDDEQYKLNRAIKQKQLNNDKDTRLFEERSKFKETANILESRAKQKAEDEIKLLVEEKRIQGIKDIKSNVLRLKAERLKALSWTLFDYDKETYKALLEIQNQIAQDIKDRKRLDSEIEANKVLQQKLSLEEEKTKLEIKKSEEAIHYSKQVESEKAISDNELKKARALEANSKHELEIKAKDIELRKIQAKEDENRLKEEDIQLRRKELENRNKEDENIAKLIKYNNINHLFPQNNKVQEVKEETSTEVVPESDVKSQAVYEKNEIPQPSKSLGKILTALVITGAIAIPGYFYADSQGLLDDKQEVNKTETKDHYKSYIEKEDYVNAIKEKPSKAKEIKKLLLDNKDYLNAVKVGQSTNDKEYLITTYLSNGNLDDLFKTYKSMSYEEKMALPLETKKAIVNKYIADKSYTKASIINKDAKIKPLQKKIDKALNQEKNMKQSTQTAEEVSRVVQQPLTTTTNNYSNQVSTQFNQGDDRQ
ncbi:hypothetical protein [Macrococcus sp. PK]|uniref:hypothetical protein n=1 Tax=Macrococcus sp. PK TaxID=2801919 RepID=UPI001F116D7E|nr:hypothetical protein [Macrococcus sp. PK]MCH4984278.1 hypothetical protein [Macrococcus sp. PK]